MLQATRHTLSDLLHYLPSVIVPFLFGLISVAVFTRLLSPAEYGLFNIILATSLFAEIIAFHWLNQSILRYYERYKTDAMQAFYTTCLVGFLSIAVVSTVLFLVVIPLFDRFFGARMAALVTWLPLLIVSQAGFKFVLVLLRAMRRGGRYSFQTGVNAVGRLALSLLALYMFGYRAEALLLGTAIAAGMVFLVETTFMATDWRPEPSKFDRQILKRFARFGIPLLALAVVNLILSVSDRYLIEILQDSAQVGIYSAGYKIAETAVFGLVLFLTLASFPALIEAYEKRGADQAVALMSDHLSMFVLLVLPAVIGISVLAGDIIRVTLGDAFQQARELLAWIAAGIFFMGLSQYYAKSFELKERTVLIPLLYSGPALLNVGLNLMLIPKYGLKGAAVATFAAYLACWVLAMLFGRRYIRWRFPWLMSLKALCAALFMAVMIHRLPPLPWAWLTLLSKIMAGLVIYGLGMALLERRVFQFVRSFLKL